MSSAGADFIGTAPQYAADSFAVIQERDQLLPGQTHAGHDSQIVVGGDIKQPSRRAGVGADGVDPMGRHRGKITMRHFRIVVGAAQFVGAKRPIGYAARQELLVADEQEFSLHERTLHCGGPHLRAAGWDRHIALFCRAP